MLYLFSIWFVLVVIGGLFSYLIYYLFKKDFKINSIFTVIIIAVISIGYLWFIYNTFGYNYIIGLENVY